MKKQKREKFDLRETRFKSINQSGAVSSAWATLPPHPSPSTALQIVLVAFHSPCFAMTWSLIRAILKGCR
ncbi:hypothetical protein E2C01_054681 [Portunus trituberculatus]|uniref:Uncharacterized protein n=1 Tax=Portunus trituberculatus TaxID=210409 RepID=A0A5B7GUL4_PORTR|nr:hypothetical protein [Portunus trituberculatus]